jgi:hypothetical protein
MTPDQQSTVQPAPRWQKWDDGYYHPTPPYVLGEIAPCEGCGRPTRVNESAAIHQWIYSECEPCGRDEDAWVMQGE